jgi:hypothetical protein
VGRHPLRAALSDVAAIAFAELLGRGPRPAILVTTAAGPIAWTAILRATDGRRFFTDAPIPVFPIPAPNGSATVVTVFVLRWIWCDGIPISTAGSATNATAHSST